MKLKGLATTDSTLESKVKPTFHIYSIRIGSGRVPQFESKRAMRVQERGLRFEQPSVRDTDNQVNFLIFLKLILEYVGVESEVNIASAEVSDDLAAAVSKRVADATVAEAGKVRLPADAADYARAELAAADTKLAADASVAPETHAKKTADIDPETHAKKTADMANVLGALVKDCTISTNEYTWYNTFRFRSGDRSLNVCSTKRNLSYSKYSGAM